MLPALSNVHIGDPEVLFTVRANIDVVSLVIVIFEDVTLPSLLTVNLLTNDVFFTTRGKADDETLESVRDDDPTDAHVILLEVEIVTAAILLSICACVYPEALVKTELDPHIIAPLASIVQTTEESEFLIVKGMLTASDVTITNGDTRISSDLITILF